jgi:hypothetical protein
MQVQFLGGAAAVGATCHLVSLNDRHLLVDAGAWPHLKCNFDTLILRKIRGVANLVHPSALWIAEMIQQAFQTDRNLGSSR